MRSADRAGARTRWWKLDIVAPPTHVAEILGLEPDRDVVMLRKRVRLVDDRPDQLADSYFPEPLVWERR